MYLLFYSVQIFFQIIINPFCMFDEYMQIILLSIYVSTRYPDIHF